MKPGKLAMRVRSIAALNLRWQAELMRIGQPPIWDQEVLLARVEKVHGLFKAAATKSPKVAAELQQFEMIRPKLEMFIKGGGLRR